MYVTGQIIGILGFAFSVFALMQKKDNHVRNYLGVSSSLVAVSYYLIGAYAGALIILTSAVRNFVAARPNTQKFFPVFIALNIAAAIYVFEKPYDILPLMGVLCSTVSIFKLSGLNFRIGMVAACAFWLVYNVITMSIGPMMMEVMNITALSYAIWRIKHGRRVSEADHTNYL